MYSNMRSTYLKFVYIISHTVPSIILIITIYCYNKISTIPLHKGIPSEGCGGVTPPGCIKIVTFLRGFYSY